MPSPADPYDLGPLQGWLDAQDLTGLDNAVRAGQAVTDLVASGCLDLPLPGAGATAGRWAALSALGRADLVLARLGEGHADADAILHELTGAGAPSGQVWGVWAADPPPQRVTAQQRGGRWALAGTKPWCSGAGTCTHALVTAHADDGYRLFAVEMAAGPEPVDGTWPAVGMSGSDSRSVRLDGVSAEPVGGPGAYLDRAGFWHGGVGVAAVWLGGARGVADALASAHGRRPLGPHALAHAGAVDAVLHAAAAAVDAAAADADARPHARDAALLAAARTRLLAARAVAEVLDRTGSALGAGPLSLDRTHARRVADLAVYVRQHHGERDAEALGALVLDGRTDD